MGKQEQTVWVWAMLRAGAEGLAGEMQQQQRGAQKGPAWPRRTLLKGSAQERGTPGLKHSLS